MTSLNGINFPLTPYTIPKLPILNYHQKNKKNKKNKNKNKKNSIKSQPHFFHNLNTRAKNALRFNACA